MIVSSFREAHTPRMGSPFKLAFELVVSKFQPKRRSLRWGPPDQENHQGMRMLTMVSAGVPTFSKGTYPHPLHVMSAAHQNWCGTT